MQFSQAKTCYASQHFNNMPTTREAENEQYTCDDCGDSISEDEQYTCDDCNRTLCNECVYVYDEATLCRRCDNDRENNNIYFNNRNITHSAGLIGKRSGSIIKSSRIFGVEIETLIPSKDSLKELINKMSLFFGIESDSSIEDENEDYHGGIEIQTPKMSKMIGQKEIENVCKLLKVNDFGINQTCGLHIHLDAKDFTENTKKIRTLILFYIIFEDVFLSFLPKSRRKNSYCKKIKTFYHLEEILNVNSISQLEKLWYREQNENTIKLKKNDKWDQTRYCGINLHALFSQNNLEIRYHSGTISSVKILYWIALHQTVMDAISSGKIVIRDLHISDDILEIQGKVENMFSLLNLSSEIKSYFWKRYKKFNMGNNNDDENTCAE